MQTQHQSKIDATTLCRQLADLQRQLASDLNVPRAIAGLKALLADTPRLIANSGIEQIEDDYRLMCNFMLKGFEDSHRDAIYHTMAAKLLTLLRNLLADTYRLQVPFFTSMAVADVGPCTDADAIRRTLEQHVQDVAMLSLDDSAQRDQHARQLHEAHFNSMRTLFNGIVLSHQWTADRAHAMATLLTSPTIDTADAQLLTSAIGVALLLVPDEFKVEALIDIYGTADDRRVRQRALVGWVFGVSCSDSTLAPGTTQKISSLLASPKVRKEVLQLQQQVLFCQNATRDQEALRNDIMPTIMKNQPLGTTRFGLDERQDDNLDEMLHPDDEDRKMEELEESFQKIQDMQQRGVDIYFGGFSQMKRFSFFYTFCNWFMPFYAEHPQLNHLSQELLQSQFMQQLMQQGPFCDSDKYSFALAFSSVYTRLPENIREMMEKGTVQAADTATQQSAGTDAYIRRTYLQDLYRFFNIHDHRSLFANPFAAGRVFMACPVLATAMPQELRALRTFLLKQRLYAPLRDVLAVGFDAGNADDLRMKACVAAHYKDYAEACSAYTRLLEINVDDEQALRGLAQACLNSGRYDEADRRCRQLLALHPDDRKWLFCQAVAQLHTGQENEAKKTLYKLHYNYPDDLYVKRALAWAELWLKNTGAAQRLYDALLASADVLPADLANAGFCSLMNGQVSEAVRLLAESLAKQAHNGTDALTTASQLLAQDSALLDRYDISQADRIILADLVDRHHTKNNATS